LILDLAVVAFIGFWVYRGLKRGLLASLAGLAGFVVAAFAAVFGFRIVARPLEAVLSLSSGVANLVGAIAIFLTVYVGFLVIGRLLTRALRWTKAGRLNAAAGATVSGVWALSFVTAVLLAISIIPAPSALATQLEGSTIGKGIVEEAPRWAQSVARTDLRRALTFFFPDERRVAIIATDDIRGYPEAERLLFDLVNEERRARGQSLLRWDERLAGAGRRHARDMYRRGYFGHTSPNGRTQGDRLLRMGASYRTAGENLALAPTARAGHAQLMGSTRHRAHILGPNFDRVGIGVVLGRQGLLIVEEFTG
jgi:uncharacterized membrane protein required for colicin V production